MSNNNSQDDDTLSVEKMQNALNEKAVASVVLGENGTLVVQYGEKLKLYPHENSAKLASRLLEVIAEALEK